MMKNGKMIICRQILIIIIMIIKFFINFQILYNKYLDIYTDNKKNILMNIKTIFLIKDTIIIMMILII